MLRCDECGRRFHANFPEFAWNDWLKLLDFMDFLRTEESITEATWETMTSALMSFRPEVGLRPPGGEEEEEEQD
jgi:hypothetical protein